MYLKSKFTERLQLKDIQEIVLFTKNDSKQKQELYYLLFDSNDTVAFQAAWAFSHFDKEALQWLASKQDELIDEVLICRHGGKRRLLLALIEKQSLSELQRTDFLDFCMERAISKDELPAVQSLCLKIAYKICSPYPELLQELKQMLEIMEPDFLLPSILTVRRNILEKLK